MSQTEIICACIIGVISLLVLFSLFALSSILEYKAKMKKTEELKSIANACFGIEEDLEHLSSELSALSYISADLGEKILDEIKKVGE